MTRTLEETASTLLHAPEGEALTRTPEQVQAWFRNNGIIIVEWSLEHGFNPDLVYAVLRGKRACVRGQSHAIAMALGMKRPDGSPQRSQQ